MAASSDEIRALFASALSDMYRPEVPQYGTLLDIVSEVNKRQQENLGLEVPKRFEVERHGAIRLGTGEELATMRRLFSIMDMQPVGYYDLSVAGLPVHATCFRPVTTDALAKNPFRVFTSLLRLDLIQDDALRQQAVNILKQRCIFTPRCLQLLDELEHVEAIPVQKAEEFLAEALETFRWHKTSTVDLATYKALQAAHPLIADVVCFRGPHINHLTPRVTDIDAAQAAMLRRGLAAKDEIEGPPALHNPVLLRQTSFLALEEEIAFSAGVERGGKHKARFGEIEQRGMALTPSGRQLYDTLIDRTRQLAAAGKPKKEALTASFEDFPDNLTILRRDRLAYFTYSISPGASRTTGLQDVDALVDAGVLLFQPITYEDFLPVSAAGIFHSNLGSIGATLTENHADQATFEKALRVEVNDSFKMYEQMEAASIASSLGQLAV